MSTFTRNWGLDGSKLITVHVPQARHHPLQPVSETVNSDEVVWEGLLWGSGQKRMTLSTGVLQRHASTCI